VTGNIDPTKEQFAAFLKIESKEPIWMLNQIRLRAQAAYPDGRGATGREAYAAYAKESMPFFSGVGGRIIWSSTPQLVLIGPTDEKWDLVFVAEYPNSAAFAEMVRNPGYQAIVVHRQAAVEDSRLIRLAPGESGKVFG